MSAGKEGVRALSALLRPPLTSVAPPHTHPCREQARISKADTARAEAERALRQQAEEVERKKEEIARRDLEREAVKVGGQAAGWEALLPGSPVCALACGVGCVSECSSLQSRG